MAAVQQIVIGLLILGVLILIHELGHFLVAKWNGIRVLSFSIGFGPVLFKRTWGETEYRLSVIPFGGYVHMAGEHPEDEHEQAEDEFNSKPIWRRISVAVAGPGANYVFSLLLLAIAFMYGVEQELYLERPIVGAVMDNTAAANSPIQPGDSVLAVNGEPVDSWEAIGKHLTRPDDAYEVVYSSKGTVDTTVLRVDTKNELTRNPYAGLLPPLPAEVGTVRPETPAAEAGLQEGDEIIAIDSVVVHSWYQLTNRIADYDSAAGPLLLTVRRNGAVTTVDIAPEFDQQEERYLLGIEMARPESRTVRYGLFAAIPRTFSQAWDYTTMIFDMLGKLITREVSANQLAGPVGIVQLSGAVAKTGLVAIFNFMALIGINLAVINLFPLIITDGGMILFLIIEAVRGKPLSLKTQMLINRIAIFFFIALFLAVTFNDIRRFGTLFRMFNR
jgi:regulator of sigma E protease